ncbi:MAG: hypothetical protein RLZZ333_1026 [Bacteroidota bacterium]
MNYVTFELESDRMICLKVDIPDELNQVDDECKAIYHCKTSVCFYLFKSRELRNAFVEETKGMMKAERMEVYNRYKSLHESN